MLYCTKKLGKLYFSYTQVYVLHISSEYYKVPFFPFGNSRLYIYKPHHNCGRLKSNENIKAALSFTYYLISNQQVREIVKEHPIETCKFSRNRTSFANTKVLAVQGKHLIRLKKNGLYAAQTVTSTLLLPRNRNHPCKILWYRSQFASSLYIHKVASKICGTGSTDQKLTLSLLVIITLKVVLFYVYTHHSQWFCHFFICILEVVPSMSAFLLGSC